MHILEHRDDRSVGGEGLEEPSNRPVDLLGSHGLAREAEEAGEPIDDGRRVFRPLHERVELRPDLIGAVLLGDPGGGGEDLDDRPVRDPVAVGNAPSVQRDRVGSMARGELVDEA